MANQTDLSLIESLPQDLLGDILARVAATSREDLSQCLVVSKTLGEAVKDDRVYKQLNLRHFAMNPLITYNPRYNQLMKKGLASDNLAAHYVQGIRQYFVHDNTHNGLFHLKKAADGSYANAKYLYGIILLCTGNIGEGKIQLQSLGWEVSKRLSNRCWRENKMALTYIHILRKNEYLAVLRKNKPPAKCHINDMDTTCKRCYHYKQMKKFIDFIH